MSASILEKKTWKIETIINMLNKIILDLRITSAELNQYGRGIGSIANETAKLLGFLEKDVLNAIKFEDQAIEDVQDKMEELGSIFRLLGINAILEAKRLNNPKAYILCDEIKKIGESIQNVLEMPAFRKNLTMINPDRSFREPFPYIVFNIAGTYWAQNMNSIMEIVKINKEMLINYPDGPGKMKHQVILRGNKMPIVNLYSEMGEELSIDTNSRIVILNLGHIMYGHTSSDLYFGLVIDDIEYAGYLNKGVHELEMPSEISAEFVRHTWKTKDVNLMFFNWDNIIKEHEIRDYRKIESK